MNALKEKSGNNLQFHSLLMRLRSAGMIFLSGNARKNVVEILIVKGRAK